MSTGKHLSKFKTAPLFFLLVLLGSGVCLAENQVSGYSKRKTGLYRDIFDQNLYYEGTNYLHLERLYRALSGRRKRSLDVNAFDEVPDSTFFTNRHGRESLSLEDLKRGASVTEGPDAGGKLTITKGKYDGITPGFFIRDEKGDKYLLKFDPIDNLELATAAEVISSRLLYALGYNVPQYTVTYFKKDRLVIKPGVRFYDETGFLKKLTPERLEGLLLSVPLTEDGSYRASASRILQGEILGPMKFMGRRKDDPEDRVNHEARREIRALQVFNAWLNNYDVREGNSLDVVEEKDGARHIRHYLIDFNSALGATPRGAKPPQFGHEYMIDFGETVKAFFSLGFWQKPWQKRWEEAGQTVPSPRVGYFDNRYFRPDRYRTQLPQYAFKDLTRADGFWAAKIIMKFTTKEIEEIVSTGELSDDKARKDLVQILAERRDLIGRYWFKEANPLDEFKLFKSGDGSYELRFEDLAVRYGFAPVKESVYHIDLIGKKGDRGIRLEQEEIREGVFRIHPEWLGEYSSIDLLIRTRHPGEKGWSPSVRVEVQSADGSVRLSKIFHQD